MFDFNTIYNNLTADMLSKSLPTSGIDQHYLAEFRTVGMVAPRQVGKTTFLASILQQSGVVRPDTLLATMNCKQRDYVTEDKLPVPYKPYCVTVGQLDKALKSFSAPNHRPLAKLLVDEWEFWAAEDQAKLYQVLVSNARVLAPNFFIFTISTSSRGVSREQLSQFATTPTVSDLEAVYTQFVAITAAGYKTDANASCDTKIRDIITNQGTIRANCVAEKVSFIWDKLVELNNTEYPQTGTAILVVDTDQTVQDYQQLLPTNLHRLVTTKSNLSKYLIDNLRYKSRFPTVTTVLADNCRITHSDVGLGGLAFHPKCNIISVKV